jgi:hypothetical protein
MKQKIVKPIMYLCPVCLGKGNATNERITQFIRQEVSGYVSKFIDSQTNSEEKTRIAEALNSLRTEECRPFIPVTHRSVKNQKLEEKKP